MLISTTLLGAMPLIACPTDVVDAPTDVAWSMMDPARLDTWWDARVRRVVPAGPLSKGQRVEAGAGPGFALGLTMDVLEVDHDAHRARLLIRLPLGVVNDEMVTMTPLGPDRCRVTFG